MIKQGFYLAAALSMAAFAACKNNDSNTTQTQHFVETANMDSSVKPGDNFFLFVNGKWIQKTEIPSTETRIGSFTDLGNRTRDNIKTILESAAKANAASGSAEQKIGDFYTSGMDSAAIEKQDYEPVKPYLQKAAALTDAKSIMQFESDMHKDGFSYLMGLLVGTDEKNSSINIVVMAQTGIGLPDRDYYFKTDAPTVAIQDAYKDYMKKVFVMTGDDSAAATAKVTAVYELEKQMAQSHRTNVELRNPEANYNKTAVATLNKQEPALGWSTFLTNAGAKVDSVDVMQPAYYAKINQLITTTPIAVWKDYYRFHIVSDAAPYLSTRFVNAAFNFNGIAVSGQKELKPRWERIYHNTDDQLGDLLGKLYVDKFFTANAKKRMLEMVNNLQKSFENRINGLDWMSDSTKVTAKAKLNTFLKKIGFPDKWRDYSKVTISKTKFFNNIVAANRNNVEYMISKAGKPVDKTEWGMTPPTINAYYNPSFNEIVFPAGILQFPFFDPNADDAINYGGIGMVIGHEMTHAFDDQGAQYDKDGNMKNWWGKADKEKFDIKSKQVVDLYNTFTMLDTLHVNGALTTGENMADVGGIAIAYDAFQMTAQSKDTTKIDGFTPNQRFFISLGQIWRSKTTDKATRLRISTDPHSPAQYRVNGPLMNFTPFYQAFNVQPGDKMYKPENERIKIW